MLDLPQLSGGDSYVPGRVADWRIELRGGNDQATRAIQSENPLTIPEGGAIKLDRSDYLADIDCQLASGLQGHRVGVTLDRISDQDHRRIARAYAACIDAGTSLILDLHLGWADGGKAYFGMSLGENLTKVGQFAIDRLEARIEGIKRSLHLAGQDLLLETLRNKRITTDETFATHADAAREILRMAGVGEPEPNSPVSLETPDVPSAPAVPATGQADEQEIPIPARGNALALLRTMGSQIEAESGRWGRKPYLVRDGGIAVGTDRDVPFGHKHETSVATGLISVQLVGTEQRDRGYDPDRADDEGPPLRKRFEVRHLGAPELKVGDTIVVPVSQADSNALPLAVDAVLPPTGDDETLEIYIASVQHVLGKNTGFMTKFSGVVVDTARSGIDEDAVWNIRSNLSDEELRQQEEEIEAVSAAGRMGQSVMRAVDSRLSSYHRAVVGEVRYHQSTSSTDPRVPQFTSWLYHGTVATNAATNGEASVQNAHLVRNGEIMRDASRLLAQIPYATPFAWGKFGLVLPRYPGMRVFSVPRDGSGTDYVDVGSVWHTEEGEMSAGPQEAQVGDWWLSLPIGASDGAALTDSEEGAMPPSHALACTDITNSEGERLLNYSKFTIKAGDAGLDNPGVRPDPREPGGDPYSNGILIEHKDTGARIAIDNEGAISILAAHNPSDPVSSIVMDKDGDITINARNVNFNVSGAVNVAKD